MTQNQRTTVYPLEKNTSSANRRHSLPACSTEKNWTAPLFTWPIHCSESFSKFRPNQEPLYESVYVDYLPCTIKKASQPKLDQQDTQTKKSSNDTIKYSSSAIKKSIIKIKKHKSSSNTKDLEPSLSPAYSTSSSWITLDTHQKRDCMRVALHAACNTSYPAEILTYMRDVWLRNPKAVQRITKGVLKSISDTVCNWPEDVLNEYYKAACFPPYENSMEEKVKIIVGHLIPRRGRRSRQTL